MERHTRGLTLVELLFVMTILALLVTMGMPSLAGLIQQQRLRAAAETLAATLHYARSATLMQPAEAGKVHLSFRRTPDRPAQWCYGLSRAGPCDCRIQHADADQACVLTLADNRMLKRVDGSDYPGITLDDLGFGRDAYTSFDPVRGTARAGHARFASSHALRVVLSPLGRVRLCSDSEPAVPGYAPC